MAIRNVMNNVAIDIDNNYNNILCRLYKYCV